MADIETPVTETPVVATPAAEHRGRLERLGGWCSSHSAALVLSFAAFMLIFRLGHGYLFNPWEPNYCGVVNEMLQAGDLLNPRWNGGIFQSKPIGLFWLAMPTVSLFGPNPLWFRLPVALFGLLGLAFLYRFGMRLGGQRTAVFSVLAGATMTGYVLIARQFQMDMPMAAMNAGVVLFASEIALLENLTRRGIRWRVAAIYLMLALSLLIKGLVGPGLAVIEVFLLILLTRRWRLILTFLDWRGLLIFVAVGLPWFAYEVLHNPAYMKELFFEHHFKRAAEGLFHRDFDWSFSVHHIGLGLAPWIALAPLLGSRKASPEDPIARNFHRMVWIAFSIAVIIFASQRTKFAHYFLPAYPFFALLVGHALSAFTAEPDPTQEKDRSWKPWGFILALVITGAGYILVRDVAKNHSWPFRTFSPEKIVVGFNNQIEGIVDIFYWSLVVFGIGAVLLLAFRSRRIRLIGAGTLVLAATIQVGGYACWAMPKLSEIFNATPIIEEIKLKDPHAEFAIYNSWAWESLAYYYGGHRGQMTNQNEAAEFLAKPGHRYLITEPEPARMVTEIYNRNNPNPIGEPIIIRNERVVLSNRTRNLEQIISLATLSQKPTPRRKVNAVFENGIELLGVDVEPERPVPGDEVLITMYFHVLKPVKDDWEIFIHADLDHRVRQAIGDRIPMSGAYPTSDWRVGTYIWDQARLELPDDLPPKLDLAMGLYNRSGRSRVVSGPVDWEKRVILGTLSIR